MNRAHPLSCLAAALVGCVASSSLNAQVVLDQVKAFVEKETKAGRIDKSQKRWQAKLKAPPKGDYSAGWIYRLTLDTNHGPMRFRLFASAAPVHVTNMIYMANLGAFDGVELGPVVPGFMAEVGLPPDQPGYGLKAETHADIKHNRGGLLGMGVTKTGSAAGIFYVTFGPAGWLDGKHTIFGELLDGGQALKAIEMRGSGIGKTVEKLFVKVARVTATQRPLQKVKSFAEGVLKMGVVDKKADGWRGKLPAPTALTFVKGMSYFWELTTSAGPLKIRLLTDQAPRHAASVLHLDSFGFFDGLPCTRALDYVAEWKSDAPSYKLPAEIDKETKFDRPGRLGAGRRPKGSSPRIFFVTHRATPWLDGKYTVFGQVVSGMDTLKKIAANATSDGKPKAAITIQKSKTSVAAVADPTKDGAFQQLNAHLAEQQKKGLLQPETVKKNKALPMFPSVKWTEGAAYYWTLETDKGVLSFRLRPDIAPKHVANLAHLTLLGFYNGLPMHRIIPGFMVQAGEGADGLPGYSFAGEIDPHEKHDRVGVLSTANTGKPKSDSSQFFITFGATKWLDGKHTIFGHLVEGMDVLRAIEKLGSKDGKPTGQVVMRRAAISVQY